MLLGSKRRYPGISESEGRQGTANLHLAYMRAHTRLLAGAKQASFAQRVSAAGLSDTGLRARAVCEDETWASMSCSEARLPLCTLLDKALLDY